MTGRPMLVAFKRLLQAMVAMEDGDAVDLVAVRAVLVAERDQMEALGADASVRGLATAAGPVEWAALLGRLLPAVDALDVGDVDAAKDVVVAAMKGRS